MKKIILLTLLVLFNIQKTQAIDTENKIMLGILSAGGLTQIINSFITAKLCNNHSSLDDVKSCNESVSVANMVCGCLIFFCVIKLALKLYTMSPNTQHRLDNPLNDNRSYQQIEGYQDNG